MLTAEPGPIETSSAGARGLPGLTSGPSGGECALPVLGFDTHTGRDPLKIVTLAGGP